MNSVGTNRQLGGFRLGALAVASMLCASGAAVADDIKPYFAYKKPKMITLDGDLSFDTNGAQPPVRNSGSPYVLGFEAVTQYDGASFGRNFIPPDTIGAAGMKQYMSTTNGAYAVFDKYTGARLSLTSDVAFWAAAGQSGANGDSRVMYNADAKRWIVASFGASTADIQIAISDTDDALGNWKSVKYTGFSGGIADYPTLALDKNAVYIGTNNFKVGCSPGSPGATAFCGTTMNVIPINSLFNAVAPTVANMKQYVTPYTYGVGMDIDNGFAQQGVNSRSAGSTGKVMGASLFSFDNRGFKVNGLNPNNAAAATLTESQGLGMAAFTSPLPGRQPSVAIAANQRIIDTLDERISSSVYEVDGRIYMVNTVNEADYARVRYTVIDADTFAILDQGNIGTGEFDYYQGSIAVNSFGQVAIGYNRSGLQTADLNDDGFADGNISFLGRTFETAADGKLVALSDEVLFKVSLTDDYHNGSIFGLPAAGRQRWGDYSQVSVDPENEHNFYLIGQFAREYNLAEFGHPGGTGGSRWGTWVALMTTPIPEPETWAMMFLGLGVVGAIAARRRKLLTSPA